jgi:class 3 adenylate cyclase/tetratricopeptide (TPR) repeat protein
MLSLKEKLAPYGLGTHAELFAANGIDVDILPDLTDADLEKIGLSLGDRVRILKAAKAIRAESASPVSLEQRSVERRQLTVVFADLVNSTHLSASLDPEDMRAVIASYQRAVGTEVRRFGGTVAKPLGDGLLIYFGWPQAHEDDAARAVRSALASVSAVGKLSTPAGEALAMRLGIATGEVVVGDFVGEGVDEEGAVVGETPNLAARLQAFADPNTVVVADSTLKLLGRQFACTDLGQRQAKGFNTPVRVWRVDNELTAESRFSAVHGGARLGTLVGRDHEIGFIMERWHDALYGDGQLVLISGEAGLGKSRLVAEIEGRIANDHAERVLYQGSPLHTNTALYPVTRQIETALSLSATSDETERAAKLSAALPARSERDRSALRYIGGLMSATLEPNDVSAPASTDAQREAAFAYFVDQCAALALATPLLVVVEDAHWLDATTIEYVDRLVARLEGATAMIIVTYRPEFITPWTRRTNAGLLTLGRLGRRQAHAMVEGLIADGHNIAAETIDEIVTKSDGIPLFVEELTGSVVESGGDGSMGATDIPATLKDALTARLDRLGTAKEVAQAASAIGREFSASLLAGVLGKGASEIADDLERLIAIDVLFRPSRADARFVFKHALVQEAAYESMLKSRRKDVHAAIVKTLEREQPQVAENQPEVLAEHLARAGDAARAAECWWRAGRLALSRSAYQEAIGAFGRAIPLFRESQRKMRADAHRAIASAYFTGGHHQLVRQHLELAMEDAEADGDQVMVAEIAVQQGHDLIQYGGSLTDAIRYCQRALGIATRLDDEALAYGARFSLGQAYWIAGNYAESIRVLGQNLPENLRSPERVRDFGTAGSLMMDSVAILGACHAYRGEFDIAFGYLKRAEELMTSAAFDFAVVQYHLNRAHLQRGDAATALPLLTKAVQHGQEFGLNFTLPWVRGLLGYCQALLGQTKEGIDALHLAIKEAEALGLPHVRAYAIGYLAETLLDSDPEKAFELAEGALSTTRSGGYRAQEAELLRLTAAACAGFNSARAEALAGEGLAVARALGMRPEEGHAHRSLGDIKAKSGDAAAAAEHRAAARAIYSQLDMPYWLARVPSAAGSK